MAKLVKLKSAFDLHVGLLLGTLSFTREIN